MGSWDFNVPALNLCVQNSTNTGLTTADFMRPPSGHNADTLEIQTLTLQKSLCYN